MSAVTPPLTPPVKKADTPPAGTTPCWASEPLLIFF